MEDSYNIDIEEYSCVRTGDVSISDQLAGFEKLRISALTNAAEMSPLVKHATIGPNSPAKIEDYIEELPVIEDKENLYEDKENLYEDKALEDFRPVLIAKEYETMLQESSEELFTSMVENMIAKRAETMARYWKNQSEEAERRALKLKARKLQMLKQLQDNDNMLVLEKVRLDQKRSELINKQTIESMNRILEDQNKATARFASITDSHTKICLSYESITTLLQSEAQAKAISDSHIPAINTVITSITKIMDLMESGSITDTEVENAQALAANIHQINKQIVEDVNKSKEQQTKKEQEEIKRKEAAERQAAETQAKEQAQREQVAAQQAKAAPMFYSPQAYSYYKNLKSFLEQYETQYKDLLDNMNLKKFRFDCQKAVNTPVNALSSVSGSHMKDKFEKLSKLLRGERVQVLDIYVTATQHPQGLFYCTALLAKKIVRQGDLLVSSNPEAAFPLAAVTVALWHQFPEFGKLLEAYFHRECPYLVPMFLPQKEGQSDKDFYISRGYTYNSEGVVEKQDKFLKRMSGIFRLCCAIWIAKLPRFLNATNPHSLRHGWQWLAAFINLKPEPDICATLLYDFFTICGAEFFKYYGKQFIKIIKIISTSYLGILQNIDEGGPKTRLEVFLQNVLKSGHIPPPAGLLAPNTW